MKKLPWLILAVGIAPSSLLITTPNRENEPFRHSPHVANAWLTMPEVARDCLVCHDYAKGNDPLAICSSCHYKGSMKSAGTMPKPENPAFQHKDHLRYNCIDCHRPESGGPAIVPDDLPVPHGFGVCVDCHDPQGTKKFPEATERKTYEKFLTNLNASPAMSPKGFRGFRHEDHLTTEAIEKRDLAQCSVCHDSIAKSGALDLGAKQFAIQGCEKCHVQERSKDIGFQTAMKSKPSRSASTFPHDKHLSASALAKDENIKKDGCYACHVFDPKSANFDLKSNFGKYDACTSCHAHQDWKVADHGQVDNCSGCHTVGFGEMKTSRPSTTTQRPRPLSFQVASQAHPLITGKTPKDESCAKCHVSQMDSMPSRIGEKKFSHATHLPDKPQAQDCLTCHRDSVSKSNSAKEMQSSFDINSCQSCHRGMEIQPRYEEVKEKKVPLFSHSQHLVAQRKDGKAALTCLDCHQAEPNAADKDVGILAAATNCSQCHDHKENFRITSGKDQKYVNSCTRCHASGVPSKNQPVMTDRQEITARTGTQFHPIDTSCKNCHLTATKTITESSPPLVFGFDRNSKIHEKVGTPDGCLCCHWDRQQIPKYQPTALKPKANQSAIQALRESLGNEVEGYPGENCKQ